MGLREMLILLHEQPGDMPPVTLVLAGQALLRFSGLHGAEGPCTVCQTGTLGWMDDKTQYSRMVEWTFDLPEGATVDDIAAALEVLIERHESLRTTYLRGDPPLQRVAGSGLLAVDLFEAAGSVPAGAAGLAALAGDMVRRLRTVDIDPTAELPMRVAVATVSGVPRAAVAVFHHIAVDLGGMAVVGRQFTELAADRTSRVPGPRGHQPLDQAMAERSPTLRRRAAAGLRDWERRLRTMPQLLFAVPPGGPGEAGQALAGWLLSPAAALAVRHIAVRTGLRRQAAVLAALCAVLSVRTGQPRCVLAAPASNRSERRLREYVGTVMTNTLLSINTDVAGFDELVQRAVQATMISGRAALADVAERQRLIKEIEFDRGITYFRSCVFNDAASYEPEPAAELGDLADVPKALERTELRVTESPGVGEALLLLALLQVDEELVLGAMTADTSRVARADIESLLRGVELLLVEAASGDVSLSRISEITGVRPPARDEDWLQVDNCWIQLSEVRRLANEALPGCGARVFPVPGDGGVCLVAYLTTANGIGTPEQAHAACMSLLHGTHRAQPPDGVRLMAMAPSRYVVCAQPPDDPSDLAAWQRQRVLADGRGRSPWPVA
ncbi:MAG TPA: condensation domain-containing protein [Trebonia sp.]|nr:condensation domain-containing protein [Trebonia sp.]